MYAKSGAPIANAARYATTAVTHHNLKDAKVAQVTTGAVDAATQMAIASRRVSMGPNY
jgi:hypothetical protein